MDILTVSDLLKAFVDAETQILNAQDIKHPTTIGTMFEGLTEAVLRKSVFKGLNLKIVKNSFIVGCDQEFDIMLVEGEGDQIPYTDRFKYIPNQIIAIIQVRKNLYSKDIEDGYKSLGFLLDYYEDSRIEEYMFDLFRDGFRGICRKDTGGKPSQELSFEETAIFHVLRAEAILPVRIIWGYNGFSSEYNFRQSFFNYLNGNETTDIDNRKEGFGPHNFPSLIICGKYSLIKANGMPMSHPLHKDKWWSFFASSSYNPTFFFLELIWTRLTYRFEELTADIFGEDLSHEPTNRFLDCRAKKWNGLKGWEYNFLRVKKESLEKDVKASDWCPVELDDKQAVIIQELGRKESINLIGDAEFESFILQDSDYTSLEDFIERIKATGLVYVEDNKLKFLTDECHVVFLPSGKIVAGENKTGRLTKWVGKEILKSKKEKKP